MNYSPLSKSQSRSLRKNILPSSSHQNSKSMPKNSTANIKSIHKQDSQYQRKITKYIKSSAKIKEYGQHQQKKYKKKNKAIREITTKPCSTGMIGSEKVKKFNQFIGNRLKKKLESYYLFLVLARLKINAPIPKLLSEKTHFIVYIGKGNNSKLIKRLFQNRHWWVVTHNVKTPEIDLFWTQQSKSVIFTQLDKTEEFGQNRVGRIICRQEHKKHEIINQFNSILSGKYRDSVRGSFVATEKDCHRYIKENKNYQKSTKLTLTCNHIEGHSAITDKKNLLLNLQKYCTQINEDCFQITPLSYHVHGKEQEFTMLKQIQCKILASKQKLLWITKPGEKSNRGNGIKIFNHIQQIQEHICKQSATHPNRTYIVQQYIFPTLYHRRKFDIRCFVLVLASPLISAYFYNGGYIRTSAKEFTNKKVNDILVHLTNDAIQKKAPDYGKYQKGNKITFEEYQDYLDSFGGKVINFQRDILPKIKIQAAQVIAAGSKHLNRTRDHKNNTYSFEIYGYDFIIDENFKSWVIEVNTNPCLETGCPVLDDFIPNAVDNAFKLAVDTVFRPPKVNDWPLQKIITFPEKMLKNNNKYELIYQ